MSYWEVNKNWLEPDTKKAKKSWTDIFKSKTETTRLKEELQRVRDKAYHLENMVSMLKLEISQKRHTIYALEREISDLKNRLYDSLGRQYSKPNINIDWVKRNLKFLIFACHPDRNNGRPEAQEVTKILLDLRRG